jgi:hypothetical protein
MPVVKTGLTGDWRERWCKQVQRMADWQVPRVLRRSDARTLADEWAMRAVAGPTGSASTARISDALGRTSVHASDSDRPNKKACLSVLKSGWLAAAWLGVAVNIARCSTKPEPGNKPRALFSSGDLMTFIAMHGLRGFEGSANYGGMDASQKPEVIGRWLVGAYKAMTGIQVSADLDDQNWQHELWELQELWESRARAFDAAGTDVARSKAASCRWVASSFQRSVVKHGPEAWRVFVGLYSGHRGTTEDNTSDHDADRCVVLQDVGVLGYDTLQYDVTESGDDEWLWQQHWRDVVAYLGVSKMCGIRMNARKQLVGRHWGEYLQRCVSEDAPPRQSLAAILATLTTGNWYQPSGTWLNGLLDATCANWLEASARGLPRAIAASMCAMCLDQTFVLREEGHAKLEWRSYIRRYPSGRDLFEGCEGFGSAVPPDAVVRSRTEARWANEGVSDYLRTKQGRWILRTLGKEWLREQFKESVAVDAMGSQRARYERDQVATELAPRWPRQKQWWPVPPDLPNLAPAPGRRATALAWVAAANSGKAVSIEDNMAAMGVGGREAQMLGGYENLLRHAPPEQLVRVRPLAAAPVVQRRVACDANVLAGLCVFKAAQPGFGLVDAAAAQQKTVVVAAAYSGGVSRIAQRLNQPMAARCIVVVAATHGCGVSRIARRFNQHEVARWDRLSRALVGADAYHRPTGNPGYDDEVHRGCERLVAQHLASGYRPQLRMVFTHERPNEIVRALRAHGIEARWVMYCPDEAARARRIAARNVSAALLRYMQAAWTDLYYTEGRTATLTEEQHVVQYVTAL